MTGSAPTFLAGDRSRPLAGGGAGAVPAAGISDAAARRQQALLTVLVLSLRAIEGRVTLAEVGAAHALASTAFPPDHHLLADLLAFSDACMGERSNASHMAAGKALGRAVSRATWPDQGARADVWG